jgi:hypothetical protein
MSIGSSIDISPLQHDVALWKAHQRSALCKRSERSDHVLLNAYIETFVDIAPHVSRFSPAPTSDMNDRVIFKTNKKDRTCPICINTIEIGHKCEEVYQCGHAYHVQCAKRWFDKNPTCPMCRKSLFQL